MENRPVGRQARREASAVAHLLAILAVGLAASLPIALWGFCLGDPIHLIWSRHFANQLWSGELYPRWLMDMNSGMGSPTFFFYGCVPFYITSLFHAVVPYRDYGWPAVGLSASLALVASGFAAFLWLREVVGRNGALAGALGYMLVPYHLEMDHLVRFAFAECWAFVWFPLVLACTHRCVRGDGRAVVPLALSYALLVMTHAPSTLLFSAVPVAYALCLAAREEALLAVKRVAGGLFVGAMLGAIYLLPALTMQQTVSMTEITEGYYSYINHFLFTTAPLDLPGKSQSFIDYAIAFRAAMNRTTRITAAFVLGGYVLTLLLARAARRDALPGGAQPRNVDDLRFASFWVGIAFVALFMMSTWSAGIWSALPVLQKVQFPWRLNILLVCATAAVFATGCSSLIEPAAPFRNKDARGSRATFVLALLIAGGMLALFGTQIVSAVRTLNESRFAERSVPARVLIEDYSEYRPSSLRKEYFVQEVIQQLGQSLPLAGVVQGTGSVEVTNWRPRHIVFTAEAKTDIQVRVKQLYYPGWNARPRGESTAFPVTPSEPEALVKIQLPPGKHEIVLSLDATTPERAGQIVSAAALAALLLMAWRSRNKPSLDYMEPKSRQH